MVTHGTDTKDVSPEKQSSEERSLSQSIDSIYY